MYFTRCSESVSPHTSWSVAPGDSPSQHDRLLTLTVEPRKKASAESSAGRACLHQVVNVVFALVWAVRLVFAVWERWHLALPCSPLPEERDAARSAVPGVRVAACSEDAIHERSSQLAR